MRELIVTVPQGYRSAAREALLKVGSIEGGAYTDGSTTWTFRVETPASVDVVDGALRVAGIGWCNVREAPADNASCYRCGWRGDSRDAARAAEMLRRAKEHYVCPSCEGGACIELRGDEDELEECEGCGEQVAELLRVHGAGYFCRACHDDHPMTVERARADMNEED